MELTALTILKSIHIPPSRVKAAVEMMPSRVSTGIACDDLIKWLQQFFDVDERRQEEVLQNAEQFV